MSLEMYGFNKIKVTFAKRDGYHISVSTANKITQPRELWLIEKVTAA